MERISNPRVWERSRRDKSIFGEDWVVYKQDIERTK
jgi:hypothetical protein